MFIKKNRIFAPELFSKMKQTLLPLAFLFSLAVSAQSFAPSPTQVNLVNKGKKAFAAQNWFGAVKSFEKAVDLNSGTTSMDGPTMAEITLQTAVSYEKMGNRKKAANWYEKAKSYNPQNKELMLSYARSLQAANRDADAVKAFEEYALKGGDAAKSKSYLEVLNKKIAGKLTTKGVEVKSLKLRGDLSCYAPVLFGNSLLFVSPKKKEPSKEKPCKGMAYRTDLFQAKQKMNGDFGIPNSLCTMVNSSAMEDGACLNKDFSIVYFSRQRNSISKEGSKLSKWGIFKTELACINEATVLPFVTNEHNFSHPSFNNSGTLLYFSSDMPGGQGGMDIYRVSITESGFGKVENLGPEVNSSADELYPNEENGKLYYSSNGFPGFGGFDIFSVDIDPNGKSTRRTLLLDPINSNYNEFSYVSKPSVGTYFSSNRNGEYDVFKVTGNPTQSSFEVRILDASTGTPLSDTKVELIGSDKKGEILFTDQDGKVLFESFIPSNYTLLANKNGYSPLQLLIDGSKQGALEIKMDNERQLLGSVVNASDKSPIANAEIQWLNEDGKDGFITHSGTNGLYVFDKAGPAKGTIQAKAKGFKDLIITQNAIFSNNGTIVLEPGSGKVTKDVINNNSSDFATVYFGYGSSVLAKTYYSLLRNVASRLKSNKKEKITITGMTDDKGNDKANKNLALKRAQSVKEYLIDYGVSQNQITLKTIAKVPVDDKCQGNLSCIEKSRLENRKVSLNLD